MYVKSEGKHPLSQTAPCEGGIGGGVGGGGGGSNLRYCTRQDS